VPTLTRGSLGLLFESPLEEVKLIAGDSDA
jgi:hypothetical protein